MKSSSKKHLMKLAVLAAVVGMYCGSVSGQSAGAGVLRMVTWQDPTEHAFSVQVPQGWQIGGGTHRNSPMDARPYVYAVSSDGYLAVLRAGDGKVLEKVRSVLERLASIILPIGPIGSASALKLAMNVNIALIAQALSESLTFARAAGISDDKYFEALKINASNSGLAALKEPKLRNRDFSPQFSLKHMAKDLRLALETARDLKLPQTQNIMRIYEEGLQHGWAEEDFTVLARLLEQA